ncbi:MAG: hypothetical protein O7C67_19765 [Gammaproteobacteria bacterium]|nr:hypothetical protein [Gammaproteobacteria bacterium]
MKKFVYLFMSATLFWAVGASAAETGPVREFYACNYQEGKGLDDLMAVRDLLVEEIAKIGSADLSNQVTFLWTPFKATTDWDFLWFDMHENLNAMGRASDAYENSEAPAVLGPRFAEVLECPSSGIVTHEQIFEAAEEFVGDGPALVESFACTFHPGKGVADAREAVEFWQKTIDDLGIYKSYSAFMQIPLVSGTGADLYYFAVHANMTDYAARTSAYRTSAAGMEADSRFDDVQRCNSSLWLGQIIINPDE